MEPAKDDSGATTLPGLVKWNFIKHDLIFKLCSNLPIVTIATDAYKRAFGLALVENYTYYLIKSSSVIGLFRKVCRIMGLFQELNQAVSSG